MDPNLSHILLTAGVVLFATVLHGVAGFGLAALAMGVLPFFMPAAEASAIVSGVATLSNAWVWWSVRKDFHPKDFTWAAIGLVFGLPVGILLLKSLNESGMRIAIGITLIIMVVLMAAGSLNGSMLEKIKASGFRPGRVSGMVVGFLGGILGGAVAIPGPPIILYGAFMLAAGFWSGSEMKAQFTAYFGILQLIRLIILISTGTVAGTILTEILVSIPVLVVGGWIGIRLYRKVPEKTFNLVVMGLLVVLGILMLVNPVLD